MIGLDNFGSTQKKYLWRAIIILALLEYMIDNNPIMSRVRDEIEKISQTFVNSVAQLLAKASVADIASLATAAPAAPAKRRGRPPKNAAAAAAKAPAPAPAPKAAAKPAPAKATPAKAAPAKAAATKPAKKGKKTRVRRSSTEVEGLKQKAIDYVRASSSPVSISQIAAALGVDTEDLQRPVGQAAQAGLIKKNGDKRSTTYSK